MPEVELSPPEQLMWTANLASGQLPQLPASREVQVLEDILYPKNTPHLQLCVLIAFQETGTRTYTEHVCDRY